MKLRLILFSSIFTTLNVMAQSHVDALRYSQPIIGGTARSISMGGAFGALGGDFSTLSTNPAGLAVYRSSEFTFSPEFYYNNTSARYLGTERDEGKFNFNFSNLGYVTNFDIDNDVLTAVNFGIGFNRIANFHGNTTMSGVNEETSYADYMAADGNSYGLWDFGSGLFWDGYVIDGDEGNYYINDSEYGFVDSTGAFYPTQQYKTVTEKGRINEWTFSLGLNFNHFVYVGFTFGVHSLDFHQDKSWYECDADYPEYEYFDYDEYLDVTGTGYTGKFGVIVRPVTFLRLGAAVHLPVTYNISETYNTTLWSAFTNETYTPGYSLHSTYNVITPAKFIGSAAFIIGKMFIVSSDFEFMDYSTMRMRSNDYDLSDVNEDIQAIYDATLNAKVGAEARFDNLYFRGGFGYYGSPYTSTEENSDSFQLSYSGGFGVRADNFFFDVAYQYVTYDYREYQYDVVIGSTEYAPVANIDKKNSRITTTFGFKF